MNLTKRRFLLYALIGLIFGIIDWLTHISWGNLGESVLVVPIIIAMNYGIWLVPIIPVVCYEARHGGKAFSTMVAGIVTWACAIFSYYFYYGILLSTGKLPHLEHLNIFGEKYPRFWYEYWQMFKGIIVGQFFEWLFIAIIGGAILGALAYRIWRKKALLPA